jgi:hypothetical protein
MNIRNFVLLLFLAIPIIGYCQCPPDSINILTKSQDLVELIMVCPEYTGKRVDSITVQFDMKDSGSITFAEIKSRFATEIADGEIKVYNRFHELIQYAKINNKNIKTYETYNGNNILLSRMNYLSGDSVYVMTVWNQNGTKSSYEYISPDSCTAIRWTDNGKLWTSIANWKIRADTIYSKEMYYDDNGKFFRGEFSKQKVFNSLMGPEKVINYEIDKNGNRIK